MDGAGTRRDGRERTLRVALISYHTSPLASLGSSAAGGMNVYVRRLAEGLAENEIEVDVFTRHEGGESAKELEFTPGARLITVRAGPTRVLSKAELAGYTPAFARSLACYTSSRKLQYDVIHSHYWLSGLAAQALRTSRQPLVHMFHTLGRVKRHYQPDAGASDPASRDYGELSLLRSGQTVVFSTAAEVDDVERMYGFPPESVAIIPPGVDGDRFA
ncbi:MAG TPA: glycosyltransferase, partial [Chloroflexota bacterium]|nr:glycosyltransferase [Chloroflexota bacterium]